MKTRSAFRRCAFRPGGRTHKCTRADFHGVWELAKRREVGRNRPIVVGVIHQIGFAVPRVEDDDLLSEFAANAVKGADEVGVSAQQHERVGLVLDGIEDHFGREIHIGALFLQPIDAEHPAPRLVAGAALFKDCGKPFLAVLVIAFNDADRRETRKHLKIDVLTFDSFGIVRMCLDAGSEVFDGADLMIFPHQSPNELFKVEPLQFGMVPKKSVVQVAAVDIYVCSHVSTNAKAPTLTDRDLAPLRQNLAVRCAYIIAKSFSDCNRVPNGCRMR